MNTENTNLWDAFSPSLRPDQVLSLLRLGLEADDNNDKALDLEVRFESEAANPVPKALLIRGRRL